MVVRGWWPGSHGLSVTKDSHREVLDMCWPLGSELEKLDIIPLHSIDSDSQHRVLVLGCADQPADAINHLALRVQLFLLGLFAEENHFLVLLLGDYGHSHAGWRGEFSSAGQAADLK